MKLGVSQVITVILAALLLTACTADMPDALPTSSGEATAPSGFTTPDPKVFTITYEGLEGTAHSNPDTYTEETAARITLSKPAQRNGYVFTGWFIGQTPVTSLEGQTGDLVITAKWTHRSEDGTIELPDVDF